MDAYKNTINSTREITNSHYSPRVDDTKENYDILDWADKESQFKRFHVLSENIDLSNKTLLDVGCGLGDLYRHLQAEKNVPKHYTGTDLVKPMIELAKTQQPDCEFICCDMFAEPPADRKFDVIYCSGIFNLKTEDNMNYLKFVTESVKTLLSENGTIVFNFLNERVEQKYDHCFYYSPEKVKEIISESFKNVQIIDDYLINDFTVIAN